MLVGSRGPVPNSIDTRLVALEPVAESIAWGR